MASKTTLPATGGASPALTLRPTGPEDEGFLCRLYAETRSAETALVDWSAGQKDAFVRMQFAAQQRYYREQFPGARFAIVEQEGQPVGRFYTDTTAAEIRIIDVIVSPPYRGQGIAAALISELLKEAGRSGKPVRIHVLLGNPAAGLYRRLGFEDAGEAGMYRLMEWTSPKGRVRS
jgi:ribosomal protein S18 acetylase RimI-like enzyme